MSGKCSFQIKIKGVASSRVDIQSEVIVNVNQANEDGIESFVNAHGYNQPDQSSENTGFVKRVCTFLLWNINGLFSKLQDEEFGNFVTSFDFVCLNETFAEYIQPDLFKDFTTFFKPVIKLSAQGRRSGGVACIVRNTVLPFVRKLDVDCDNTLFFLLEKNIV